MDKEDLPQVLKDIRKVLIKHIPIKVKGIPFTDDEFYTSEICKALWEVYEEFAPDDGD